MRHGAKDASRKRVYCAAKYTIPLPNSEAFSTAVVIGSQRRMVDCYGAL